MKVNAEIRERIIATANALAAEGIESPTNDQVRERLGGGSLSHISPVMREWRESRKSEVAAALEIPADLKKAIETSLGQVWATANKLAMAAVETVRQDAEAAVASASAERDEALAEVTRLEERIAELQNVLKDKDRAIEQAGSELEKAREQSVKLDRDNAALTARADDRDEQIKTLRAELKEARADNKALQGELVKIAGKTKDKQE